MRKGINGTGTARKVNRDDMRAACDMIGRKEMTVEQAAEMLHVDRRCVRDYLITYGYKFVGSRKLGGWKKVDASTDMVARVEHVERVQHNPAPVHVDIDHGDDDFPSEDELWDKLARAANDLQEAARRLATFDEVVRERDTLRAERDAYTARIAQLEKDVVALRNDAEIGRAERARRDRAKRQASLDLFNKGAVEVSAYLHPPKRS